MKYILAIAAVCAAGLTCCQSVPPVPSSNRQVVGPKGSTHVQKSWNSIGEREGEAILGPLGNRRR